MLSSTVTSSSLGIAAAHVVFHFIAKAGCFFNPQPGAAAHMHAEDARIHLGEKVLAQEEHQPHGKHAETEEST